MIISKGSYKCELDTHLIKSGDLMFSSSQTNKIIFLFCIAMLIIGASAHLLNPSSPLSIHRILDDDTPQTSSNAPSSNSIALSQNVTIDENGNYFFRNTTNYYSARVNDDLSLYYYKVYNPVDNVTVYFNSNKVAFSIVPGQV